METSQRRRRLAFSDLHGRLDLFERICDFIKPEDELYCLGDCGDRGPDSWETIKAVLTHPQVKVYIKGNHEDMLVKAYKEYQKYDMYLEDYELLRCNGGADTFFKLTMERYANEWIDKINKLPTKESFINDKNDLVILSHAGYTHNSIPNNEDLMWNRTHYYDKWPDSLDNITMVHGHTPVAYLVEKRIFKDTSSLFYADNHKVDIDCGAADTGITVLFDLDTYEIHRIFGPEWDEILNGNK